MNLELCFLKPPATICSNKTPQIPLKNLHFKPKAFTKLLIAYLSGIHPITPFVSTWNHPIATTNQLRSYNSHLRRIYSIGCFLILNSSFHVKAMRASLSLFNDHQLHSQLPIWVIQVSNDEKKKKGEPVALHESTCNSRQFIHPTSTL